MNQHSGAASGTLDAPGLDPGFKTLKTRNGWFQAALAAPRSLGLARDLAVALAPEAQRHLLRLFKQRTGSIGALERDVVAVLDASGVPYQVSQGQVARFSPDRSQPAVHQPISLYGARPAG